MHELVMVGLELDVGLSLGEGGVVRVRHCITCMVYIFQYAEGRAVLTYLRMYDRTS